MTGATAADLAGRILGDINVLRDGPLSPFAREQFSPVGEGSCLILAGALLDELDAAPDCDPVIEALTGMPCPVIGFAPAGRGRRAYDACDLIVSSERDLAAIVANIDRAPLAATILAQQLRVSLRLPIVQALVAESLAYATLQAGPEFRRWLASRPDGAESGQENGLPLLLDRSDDQLSMILNRPASLNAISVEMRDALCAALQMATADESVRRVILSGVGRCFSIGGDLREFGSAPDPATAHIVRSVRLPAFFAAGCADRMEARLHGACIGAGVEIPAFAGRVVAARNSFFQLPEIRFGLIPGAGGTVSLPRRIGRQRTAYLALSARRIGAATALDWGLVDALEG